MQKAPEYQKQTTQSKNGPEDLIKISPKKYKSPTGTWKDA